MKELVAGILGGMGPEATVDLMHRIIAHTEARDDIDHVRCIVDNNPKVPSRIKALLEGGGESPAPCMADMGRRLEAWGADFLCIACNTAHNYYSAVQNAVHIPVLNMIDLTAQAVTERYPQVRRAGLLASPAVRLTELYEEPCGSRGLEVIYPEPVEEQRLLGVIKDIKGGRINGAVRAAFAQVTANLVKQGAEVLVVACTELGIICDGNEIPVVDAADVLAETIVETAKRRKALPHAAH